VMNSLNTTMNRVTDVIESVFRPSALPPTPVRLQQVMVCAMELEKDWLTSSQIAQLIDVFERAPHAAVAYQSVKDEEPLRKSWVRMKIGIAVPVAETIESE
jgi:hypothetical protein